jgi:phosphatidylglycerol lysyltransferase
MHRLAARWRTVTAVLGPLLFFAAVWVMHETLKGYRYRDLAAMIWQTPGPRLAACVGFTFLSYLLLTTFDFMALRYVRRRHPWPQVAFVSFLSYVFSHNIGFSILGGGAVRLRLYGLMGLPPGVIVRVIAFCSATYLLGLVGLGGALILWKPPPAMPPVPWFGWSSAYPIATVCLAVVAAYLAWSVLSRRPVRVGGTEIPAPQPGLAVVQTVLAAADWALAATALWSLLPAGVRPSFPEFVAVYMVGQLAGGLSHVPGGLGVFESSVLLLFPGAPGAEVVGALLVYRIIYYLIPFTVATVALGASEAAARRALFGRAARAARQSLPFLAPPLFAGLTVAGGFVLLLSAGLRVSPSRLATWSAYAPLAAVELSHVAAALSGAVLIWVGWAIHRRLAAGWRVAIWALGLGAVASLLKGGQFVTAGLAAAILLGLLPCARYFPRRTRLTGEPMPLGWSVATGAALALALWIGWFLSARADQPDLDWLRFGWDASRPRFLRAAAAVLAATAAAAAVRVARRIHLRPRW